MTLAPHAKQVLLTLSKAFDNFEDALIAAEMALDEGSVEHANATTGDDKLDRLFNALLQRTDKVGDVIDRLANMAR